MRLWNVMWLGTALVLGLGSVATANPSRADLLRFFEAANQRDQFRAYEAVPRIAPAAFLAELRASLPVTFVGAGCEGLVFRDARGRIWKLAIGVAHAAGLIALPSDHVLLSTTEVASVRRDWGALAAEPFFNLRGFLEERAAHGWPMRSQTLTRELIGTAFWRGYSPVPTPLPYFVSSAGYPAERSPQVTAQDQRRIDGTREAERLRLTDLAGKPLTVQASSADERGGPAQATFRIS